MKKLERAVVPESEIGEIVDDLVNQWRNGVPHIKAVVSEIVASNDIVVVRAALWEHVKRENDSAEVWMNDMYQVAMKQSGDVVHLSIKRRDRKPCRDWRDFQAIKNQLVGPEHEAVELYPAESRLVDAANQYHLWVVADAKFRFPFGFATRSVGETTIAKSKQRPL